MCTYVHQTGRVVQKSSSHLCPCLLPVFIHVYLVDIAAITVFFFPFFNNVNLTITLCTHMVLVEQDTYLVMN